MRAAVLLGMAAVALAPACGGGGPPSKYPPQPEGCKVQVFQDAPTMPTDNIGPVNAYCSEQVGEDACLRELEDQVCKLGGDVVWGVPAQMRHESDKILVSGRAAHTR